MSIKLIDAENAIFSQISRNLDIRFQEVIDYMNYTYPSLGNRYPPTTTNLDDPVFVTGEYVDAPTRFPAVSIIEIDDSVYRKMITTNIENHTKLTFEVNCFSNLAGYKKAEAKAIMDIVDDEFSKFGFVRTMRSPASNILDATIYRIVARYEGVLQHATGIIYTS